jgi:hypothetical protein
MTTITRTMQAGNLVVIIMDEIFFYCMTDSFHIFILTRKFITSWLDGWCAIILRFAEQDITSYIISFFEYSTSNWKIHQSFKLRCLKTKMRHVIVERLQ